MPIFDIRCRSCGYQGELLVLSAQSSLKCPNCDGLAIERLMSPTSTLSGAARRSVPGQTDHGCCGSRPTEAGCAGSGSCCGRTRSI